MVLTPGVASTGQRLRALPPFLWEVLFSATPQGPEGKFPCLKTTVPGLRRVSCNLGVSLQNPAPILLLTTKHLLCI